MSYKLWQLIHRLSPSEKSNFKKQNRTDSEPKYIEIFNYLNQMKKYDKKEFDRYFGTDNKLSRLKNYLYIILLDSLVTHSIQNDFFLKTKHHLSIAKVLYDKSLFHEASEKLKISLQYAEKSYDYNSALECTRYLRRICQFHFEDEEVKKYLYLESIYMNMIEEISQLEYLHYLISSTSFKRGNRINIEEKKIYSKVISNPYLKNIDQCTNIISKSYFYRIWTMYSEMTGDMEMFYFYAKSRYGILKQTDFALVDRWNFINALNNLIESCLFTKRLREAKKYILELWNISTSSLYEANRKSVRSVILELHLLIADNGKPDWNRIENIAHKNISLSRHFIRDDEVLETITLVTMLYFNHRKFKEVKIWFNEFQKFPVTTSRPDLQAYLIIMHLYSFYLNNDSEFIHYLLRRYDKFLNSEIVLNDFERLLISNLEKTIRAKSAKNKLTTELKALKENEFNETKPINNYNIGKYLEFGFLS